MACNKAPGEYTVNFGSKSELNPPYYVNQHALNSDHVGFSGQCTFFAADRVEQITGVDLATYASGWGDGGSWYKTAQRLGFPVYGAQEALNKRGTLAGYVISFEKAKAGYGTHVAVVESYDKATKTAWVSEMWGSQSWTCEVHIVQYKQSELFHSDMHYIDFSSLGMTAGDTMTADEVRKIIAEYKAAKTYNKVSELPFGGDTVQKLIDKGIIKGVDSAGNLGLSYDALRIIVILDRAGVYGG